MRTLIMILALYLIVICGFFVVGAIVSVGDTIEPLKALDALVAILITVPLFIFSVLVIRSDLGSKNKEIDKKFGRIMERAENVEKRLEELERNKTEE